MGVNLANDDQLRTLAEQVNAATKSDWRATPLVPGANVAGATIAVTNPADRRETVGQWQAADSATVELALKNAVNAFDAWNATPAASRAAILEHAADLLEQRMPQYIALCTKEAGKTLPDGVAEVREAVDFLRYYGLKAGVNFSLGSHDEWLIYHALNTLRRDKTRNPVKFMADGDVGDQIAGFFDGGQIDPASSETVAWLPLL